MARTLTQAAEGVRKPLIYALRAEAEFLVLSPALGNGVWPVVQAFKLTLAAYEELVRARHHSSSAQYAFRDLPEQEREAYEAAMHAITVLTTLHAPDLAG